MSTALGDLAHTLFLLALAGYVGALVLRVTGRPDPARGVAVVGAGVHAASVVARGIAAGHVPWSNMYEYSSVLALLAVAAGLWWTRSTPVDEVAPVTDEVAPVTLVLAVATMGAAVLLFTPAGPLVPALDTPWLAVHTAAAVVASAVFTVGAAATGLYLWRDAAGTRAGTPGTPAVATAVRVAAAAGASRGAPGRPEPTPRPSRAAALDTFAHRTIALGFLVWTFAVLTGAVWAEQAWGRYWGWDPKETAAFVTWVLYAAYLHARATPRWRGRRAAWLGIGAYGALLATYYVVNLVVVGLHSYA